MKQHGSLDTRLGPSNIGFTVLSPKVLPGCGRVSGRGAHLACLPRIYRGYETKYSAHPGNRDTTKTSGMGYCCPTILRRSTPFRSASGNARGCSTLLDSVSRDRAGKLPKLTLSYKMPLKKLLPMDERPYYPTLVRRRSSFPAAQQLDADVGTQGAATSCSLCLDPREVCLLLSGQLENGSSYYQRCPHCQGRAI